ncbi:NADH dehydrogenase [ubiquinone] 1 alpha subcomplex subunit 13-like [Mya arenaria]|uniref:NADH dehydrogenase [ubiquinone] 1 alpha subcomplex subunit 13-like n=1 Tax=Mya arenaria TaxID=6604 RepID=UPI0022E49B72|nr:NADH dehydrogenase [ubiquinone] 1 alpha subcomplex subunit 13-like [Mya arenaria]
MVAYKQEKAPPGGYAAITWGREFIPKKVSASKLWGGFFAVKFVGLAYGLGYLRPKRKRHQLEEQESVLVMSVFYQAEHDRRVLRSLRRMRDEEGRLFADDPNWEVGKYMGEQLYHRDHNMFRAARYHDMAAFMPLRTSWQTFKHYISNFKPFPAWD